MAYGHRRAVHMRTVVVLDLLKNSIISRVDPGLAVCMYSFHHVRTYLCLHAFFHAFIFACVFHIFMQSCICVRLTFACASSKSTLLQL